ncbi:MAG: acyclic terpene utilization AtuA family protein [Pirellulales bacterium]|nr:acyclic terpene utilization AtuA family protein [Pirellulales bacterium]
MKLGRANSVLEPPNPALPALLAEGELDLLQLDYDPPPVGTSTTTPFDQLRALHKHFYLEPSLRMITNAGSGNVLAYVEAIGAYLREHDDAGMPITAVRGDNILPRLAELAAAGISLADEATGQPLVEIKQPLLAAQVELGAGPLATAWEEESRMIVAGCYDPAAPFIAAGRSTLEFAWDDYDTLAKVAMAAQVAKISPMIVEVLPPDVVTLRACAQETSNLSVLVEKMQTLAASEGFCFADVGCDVAELQLESIGFGGTSLSGILGRAPAETWRVRLTYAGSDVIDSGAGETRQTIVRWSRVPRDAIHVSVDTRPAAEWI